ncbi:fungal-specific transcription factor domain-containing protein [Aspergillus cavernicola]|uniref:Fungal-specific transcription factor domain-containing protein n=1 Tax=Aspergillus cavernicola TaxID=176166 RepID=A0ABR4IV58_9EURO
MAPIARVEYFRVPPRWLFVKVTDTNGNYGWGDASLEGHSEAVEGSLAAFAERFCGMDADDIEYICALSGVDIALRGLKARRLGLPIHQLLGGYSGTNSSCMLGSVVIGQGTLELKCKRVPCLWNNNVSKFWFLRRARIAQGFKAVNMNATEDLAWLDSPHALNTSVERLRTVKSLGIDVGVDFHGRVHRAMAQQLAHGLAPHKPGPFLESASVSILQPDICHVGETSERRRTAIMAKAYDVALVPYCPLGPIALAASLQVDAVSANFAIQEMSVGIHYNAGSADIDTYIKNPEVWKVQDGLIDLISGPGLGIEIDEGKVRAASVNAAAWRNPKFSGRWRRMERVSNESHPNKRRSVKERIRVTRACDNCKSLDLWLVGKKLRCSGTLPCSLCQRSESNCEYTAGYTRGKVPPIPSVNLRTRDANTASEHVERSANTDIGSFPPPQPQHTANDVLLQADKHVNLPSSGNSPEPHQTDMEGHYVGPASGVSFLIRVQKRLHENISLPCTTPIFSFGDAPLPKYEPSFLVIPTKDEAKALLDRYFDFAFPTHRFLHQPQVEGWFEDFYHDPGAPQSPRPGAMAIRALLLMIFAHARHCLPGSDNSLSSCVNSAIYFAASEHHLAAETGPVRLASVQARLAQCFYLLGHSRINHCWRLFGTTARLAIAIGLHRKRRRELTGSIDFVEQECRKRVFWCMYSLDNYLSATLGRPRIFHDDEIDQELPGIANDVQISQSGIAPTISSAQSIMLAPVYHAKLSKIISGILHDLYGIRRATLQSQSIATAKYGAELSQWRKELSAFVDLPRVDMLMLTYQRQYTVLNLAFYHTQILLYRPFILKDFKDLALPVSDGSNYLFKSVHQNIARCLDAAINITSILRDLCENGKMYHTFWSCALANNADASLTHFQAGEQAQQHLATCQRVINNTNTVASVLRRLGLPGEQVAYKPVEFPQSTFNNMLHEMSHEPQAWIEDIMHDESPASYIPNLTSWGEFDSLVLTGLGELGYLFSSDHLQDLEC